MGKWLLQVSTLPDAIFDLGLHSLVVDDQVVSPKFSFFRNRTFLLDGVFKIKIHTCCRRECGFRCLKSACFHSECYSFRLYTVSPKFLATTEHSFRPPILEEQRRKHRMLRILTKRLSVSWTKGLPDDICWMIAGHLIRECAIITAQELANEDSASDSIIDLSHDVYVRHIMIEGIRYIRSLRNSAQSTPKQGETLLLESPNSSDVRNVYIGMDHLGIRHIQLSSSSKSRLRIPGLWWRKLSESSCCSSKMRTITDGLKLRDLVDSKMQFVTLPTRIYWPIQPPTVTIVDLVNLQAPIKGLKDLRMSFFECNAVNTTGYSMATNGLNIGTVHAHGQNMDLTFYKDIDTPSAWPMVWIYMPIDEGEYVTEICRRFGFKDIRPDSLGLMILPQRPTKILSKAIHGVGQRLRYESIHLNLDNQHPKSLFLLCSTVEKNSTLALDIKSIRLQLSDSVDSSNEQSLIALRNQYDSQFSLLPRILDLCIDLEVIRITHQYPISDSVAQKTNRSLSRVRQLQKLEFNTFDAKWPPHIPGKTDVNVFLFAQALSIASLTSISLTMQQGPGSLLPTTMLAMPATSSVTRLSLNQAYLSMESLNSIIRALLHLKDLSLSFLWYADPVNPWLGEHLDCEKFGQALVHRSSTLESLRSLSDFNPAANISTLRSFTSLTSLQLALEVLLGWDEEGALPLSDHCQIHFGISISGGISDDGKSRPGNSNRSATLCESLLNYLDPSPQPLLESLVLTCFDDEA
ncbi:hypothetical protein B7494_g3492 [Chlorociboria aeruginascens]|nr:hypothetical protein B7494_g3492 [Chlorociboria aeruginascens]